ncbi:MAG TPA: 2-succinyl-6-hydroxy-2,4-cyclohexadiene-1-carboxylate synthase [Opitutales bacterium]|jgi:2-succinyl-6-hydroxy-2,4-cyclohexadiene-1-carboxylate synthase|nr:2-succinyl-6-hydroxy-2,4-cyclohexadiene-1-carboxylate synthase [Opitutales bacterium]
MIVALHGFTGGGGDFAPLAEALPEHRWLTPDLPGHAPDWLAAGAPSDDCSLDAGIRFLDAIIPEKSAVPQILLGYSLGGRLALRYALARPGRVQALVLIGTSAGIADAHERASRRNEDELLAQKIASQGVMAFLADWQKLPLISTQAKLPMEWQIAMRQRREQLRTAGLAASLRQFGQGAVEPVWKRLQELRLPVLLCVGAEDEKYTALAKQMQAQITGAELLIIPHAGHMAHLENRDTFTAGLRSFLKAKQLA